MHMCGHLLPPGSASGSGIVVWEESGACGHGEPPSWTREAEADSVRSRRIEGGLMAYGPNVPDNFRRAAGYVDRILKGASPGTLPIQQPSRFDFVINMRTARRLRIALPQSMLSSADDIIE